MKTKTSWTTLPKVKASTSTENVREHIATVKESRRLVRQRKLVSLEEQG